VIKLLSSSAAYCAAITAQDPTAIYGTAFFDKKGLDAWSSSARRPRARSPAARKDLDLFHFHPLSPGAAFWTPKERR